MAGGSRTRTDSQAAASAPDVLSPGTGLGGGLEMPSWIFISYLTVCDRGGCISGGKASRTFNSSVFASDKCGT